MLVLSLISFPVLRSGWPLLEHVSIAAVLIAHKERSFLQRTFMSRNLKDTNMELCALAMLSVVHLSFLNFFQTLQKTETQLH